MKKRIFSLMLAILMALPVAAQVYAADFKLVIDDAVVDPSVGYSIANSDGILLVPLNVVSESFGADAFWNQTRGQITVITAAYTIRFNMGSKNYTVNGAPKTASAAPVAANNTPLIPLKTFADAIGASYAYDAASNTATVRYFTKMSGSLKVNGSTTLQPIAQAAADKLMKLNKNLSITVAGGGSGTGIKDAAAGTVNIGMSSREFTSDELQSLSAYAVANDGIAIIVHPDNPVKNLTKEQAKKVFLGEVKNWKDVGGENAPIMVMTRETGSGTRSTLEEMILDKVSVVATATPFTSSTLIKQAVAKDKNAVGFDSIGFVDETVKAVSLNGTDATSETVINGVYAMGRSLYCCTKGQAKGLSAVFIDYLKSQDCQDTIVENEGYVKLY